MEEKPRIVIDTNIWLLACTESKPAELSSLDKQLEKKTVSNDAAKLRGYLCRVITNYEVFVPEVIVTELRGHMLNAALPEQPTNNCIGSHNKKLLECIVESLKSKSIPHIPTARNVRHQAAIWEDIKLSNEYKHRWENKFEEFEEQVTKASKQTEKGECWKDWHDELKAINIIRGVRSDSQLAQRAKELRKKITEEQPKLVADFEILTLAKKLKASVVTFDNDFELLWKFHPENLPEEPKPRILKIINNRNDEQKSKEILIKTIRTKIKNKPPDMTL